MTRNIVQNLTFRKPTALDATALSQFIESQYTKDQGGESFKTKTSFSPSSIGGYNGLCPRYWYLAFSGANFVDSFDAMGIANMENGKDRHERLQTLLKESGILVDEEVEIKMTNPPVRGFIDVLIRWEGEVVVGEIKTCRQEMFLFRQTQMKPSAQHLLQILIYLKATGKKQGFLLYENKNSQEFLVIPVEMNEKNEAILEEALEWMRMVYDNFENGELPKRPVGKKNKICKGCPLYNECWNVKPEGTMDIPLMEVPKP